MKKILLILFAFVSICQAQITINNAGYTKTQLVTDVLAAGSGMTISNVVFKGVYNNVSGGIARYQVGAFTTGATATNLGFASGVIITSGNTSTIPIPFATNPQAGQMATAYLSSTPGEIRDAAGDADAKALVGSVRNINSAILEFDFIPLHSYISFNYVFGSEEYEDNSGLINYQCSDYNDKFGFLISGTGIAGSGTYTNNGLNIALLGNGSEVAINSVNNGVVGSSGGAPAASKCLAANPAWVNNTPTTEYQGPISGIAFNGNTKVLRASRGNLTPGATYHIRLIVTDASDGTYDSAVFLEAGSFSSPVSLPVEMVDFEGTNLGESNQLTWTTASEENLDYFGIEQSQDGKYFAEIGTIPAKGNSKSNTYYEFIDKNPKENTYYRLRSVDIDGTIEYSKILSIKSSYSNNYTLSPNPTTGIIEIQGLTITDANVNILNHLGHSVKSMQIHTNTLDISDLPQGIYYLKMRQGEHAIVKKMIRE